MELKQLQFFLVCAEQHSLSRAAEKLYTSQPNVSKVIKKLEEELGSPLFVRGSKGLELTPYGASIYDLAFNSVRNADLIKSTLLSQHSNIFSISTYHSNLISQQLVELYKQNPELIIRHRQGTIADIISNVKEGLSEIGVLYVSQKQYQSLMNTLNQNNLTFNLAKRVGISAYVGPSSPIYNQKTVDIDNLYQLNFIRSFGDFFALEDEIDQSYKQTGKSLRDNTRVFTNSEHSTTNWLMNTEIVELGLDLWYSERGKRKIHGISVQQLKHAFIIGIIARQHQAYSEYANQFLSSFFSMLTDDDS